MANKRSQGDFKVLGLIQRMDLPFTTMGERRWHGQVFGEKTGILFDMPIRHPNRNGEHDIGYMSLEIKKLKQAKR